MKLFVKYKNGSVEIVNVSELSYHTKNPCLNCRKGGGCYDHGCFIEIEPENCHTKDVANEWL